MSLNYDLPDHTHPDHGCPAVTTTERRGLTLFCTRDLGHDPPHRATGGGGHVYAEWTSPQHGEPQ